MATLFATDHQSSRLFQRLILALVIFPHGAQKLLGWFGGWGFQGTVQWFQEALHTPALITVLVILAESVGALLLAAGAFTRLAAFGIAATMLGAILLVHAPYGFFMNWSGSQAGEGFEFHLLALALSLPLMLQGGGAYALDHWLLQRFGRATSPKWQARTAA